MGTVPDLVTVRNQSSTHFNLKLLTRGIGRLRIRIKADVRGKKYSDTVEKNLFVKVRTCMCKLCICDCYWISRGIPYIYTLYVCTFQFYKYVHVYVHVADKAAICTLMVHGMVDTDLLYVLNIHTCIRTYSTYILYIVCILCTVCTEHTVSIVLSSLSPQPGCVKYEVVNTLFVNGSGDETFNFNLPKCTIPKSHEASIVIKGRQVMV